jgi:hypothetical protein
LSVVFEMLPLSQQDNDTRGCTNVVFKILCVVVNSFFSASPHIAAAAPPRDQSYFPPRVRDRAATEGDCGLPAAALEGLHIDGYSLQVLMQT